MQYLRDYFMVVGIISHIFTLVLILAAVLGSKSERQINKIHDGRNIR